MDGECVMDTLPLGTIRRELTERDKLILSLWKKGLTGTQIGLKLGTTRSAILGLINRLRAAGYYVDYRAKKRRPKKYAPSKPRKAPEKKLDQFELLMAAPVVVPPSEPSRPLTIMELTRRSCRYILNDGKPSSFLYCGKTTERGSYCYEHHKICFTVIQKPTKTFMLNYNMISNIRS